MYNSKGPTSKGNFNMKALKIKKGFKGKEPSFMKPKNPSVKPKGK